MTFLIAIFHLGLIFGIAFVLWKRQSALRTVFWPALCIKLAAGAALGLVYTYYYSVADTFHYFNDAGRLAALAQQDVGTYLEALFHNKGLDTLGLIYAEPRAVYLAKITSLFSLFTAHNYWVTGGYYSFIAFLASWFLVSEIHRNVPGATLPAVIAFLFLPSVVFWSSGVLKESLAIAGLYFVVAIFLKAWFRTRPSFLEWAAFALSLWVLWNLKYYYAGVLLPVLVAAWMYRAVKKPAHYSVAVEWLIWSGMLLLPVLLVTFLHPNFRFGRLLAVIVENNAAYHAISDPTDVVNFFNLRPDAVSFLLNAPIAIFSGLFRPLPWDVSAAIQMLPALETTMVLVFFGAAVLRSGQYARSHYRILILAALTYVVLLAALITFAAPNFGTLSRYRSGYFSLFVFVILCNNPMLIAIERRIQRLVTH